MFTLFNDCSPEAGNGDRWGNTGQTEQAAPAAPAAPGQSHKINKPPSRSTAAADTALTGSQNTTAGPTPQELEHSSWSQIHSLRQQQQQQEVSTLSR